METLVFYIELPSGIDKLDVNQAGHFCFTHADTVITLKQILDGPRDGRYFLHEPTGLTLSVTNFCPKEDKCYAEYLPRKHDRSDWCTIVNGARKVQEMLALLESDKPFTQGGFFRKDVLTKREETLLSRREDRFYKGPHSY
jgi:hypothetical protein